MAFNRLMLTTDGKTLYAKAQQGKPLHFTRVGLGDGLLGNGSLVNRPTMINERLSVPIDAIQMTAGATEAAVIVTLKNVALAEGFSFRELALFAKDPDTQSEKIYLYDHAGNDAEYIPAGSSGIAVYERLKLMIVADSTPNISFDASGNPLYVTAEELDARLLGYQEKLAGAVAKATPEDADKVPILDSADTSKPKLVLWRNIKALFAAATHVHAITDVTNLELSLSNKVEKFDFALVQNKVNAAAVPTKKYTMDITAVQAFLDALPRLLTENLEITVSGTLHSTLLLDRFYGSGTISLTAATRGGCVLEKGFLCMRCRLNSIDIYNMRIHPSANANQDNPSAWIYRCSHVSLYYCDLVGNLQNIALYAEINSSVASIECTFAQNKTAIMSTYNSSVSVIGAAAADFHDNTTGAYVWRGGTVFLVNSAPDLLGGTVNIHGGGIIVNAAGALI